MIRQERIVRMVYKARGRDILFWFLKTAFFSLITLGLYLPVAANRLVRYMCEHTEIQIVESQSQITQ
jgi:uncharacterized membrane protein YjgN (DUF898 family)